MRCLPYIKEKYKNPLQDVKKSLENLMTFCKRFNHTDLEKHLQRLQEVHENYRKIKRHKNCQRYVYNQNKKRSATIALLPEEKAARKILRSSMETFDWKSSYIVSGRPYQKNIRHPDRNNCHEVTTLHFKEQMLVSCQKRHDQRSKEVTLRVSSCNDLVAVEARYHTPCRIKFMNPEKIFNPEEKNTKKLTGRPAENKKLLHFDQLYE